MPIQRPIQCNHLFRNHQTPDAVPGGGGYLHPALPGGTLTPTSFSFREAAARTHVIALFQCQCEGEAYVDTSP